MVEFGIIDDVARITLQRPEKRNALDRASVRELTQAFDHADGTRAVVISGAGTDFCSGMDISEMASGASAGVMEHRAAASELANLYRRIRRHPQPVIAAVQGRALGGGCGLATACDIVLASESAQFGYPEVKIGFVPAI